MDSGAMVREELNWGVPFVEALSDNHFPLEMVGWVFDSELEAWRLVIATELVDEVGALEAYRRLGELAESAELPTSILQRVTVMSPSDRIVHELRGAFSDDASDNQVVTAGGSSERAYLYNERAISFERAVAAALQRIRPENTIIRRAEHLFYEDQGFDFLVDNGESRLVIEVKTRRRPLDLQSVSRLPRRLRERPPVLLVSDVPLTNEASAWLRESSELVHVLWRGPEDDESLRAAITNLLDAHRAGQ